MDGQLMLCEAVTVHGETYERLLLSQTTTARPERRGLLDLTTWKVYFPVSLLFINGLGAVRTGTRHSRLQTRTS